MAVDHADASAGTSATDGRLDLLEEQFGALFDGLRQQIRVRATAVDPSLQPAGYRTLIALAQLGPTNPTVVAENLGFDKSVLSRQLRQLEELHLIGRAPDATDGRAVVITLTADAVARIDAAKDEARDLFRARLATWDPSDLDELIRLLGRLRDDSFSAL